MKKQFEALRAVVLAKEILSGPPSRDFIKRPELLKTVVFRAVIPAIYCKEANAMMRSFRGGIFEKNHIWSYMSTQSLMWARMNTWPIETEHRPQVIAIKFSSHPNDEGSNPAKAAIDMLSCRRLLNAKKRTYTKHRLGVIKDDRRSAVDQCHWWEFLPQDEVAFALVEVRV